MKTVESRTAFYPMFDIGAFCPSARPCVLSIVEANGRLYFKTPFAFLDAHGNDIDNALQPDRPGRYYATEEECNAYLQAEYPHWELAQTIMGAWMDARRLYGPDSGHNRICDLLGLSIFGGEMAQMARGHRRFTPKRIRAAVKALAEHAKLIGRR